jgi:DNA replication licensing factor MCM3
MKKYIHIAKIIKPKLTAEACDIISEEYSKLRSFELDQNDVARVGLHFILFHLILFECF